MKTYLILARLLMTGASVYGVVDYSAKKELKEFNELYKEKPAPVATKVPERTKTPVPAAEPREITTEAVAKAETEPAKKAEKKKSAVKKKKADEERAFRLEKFSRGKLG